MIGFAWTQGQKGDQHYKSQYAYAKTITHQIRTAKLLAFREEQLTYHFARSQSKFQFSKLSKLLSPTFTQLPNWRRREEINCEPLSNQITVFKICQDGLAGNNTQFTHAHLVFLSSSWYISTYILCVIPIDLLAAAQ